ncbi:putative Thaumatin family [Helianthus annuus]|nr:putative Thaumatin family [Helianthus annuus]
MTTSILSTFLLFAQLLLHSTNAAVFNIRNNCRYTVWAGAVPGGGRRLNPGQTWALTVTAGTKGARIWPRTGCTFDGSGRGRCQTGDCNGLLQCRNYGTPPNTLAEYALNQYQNLDFIDISLVDGFNCPSQLRAPGGCNNPCTVYKTDQYCCNSGKCGPTDLSRFFKTRCPDAYSYPQDDQTSTFTCPGGTNYDVIFCP